jgi:uncharacterized protein (DUF934 family)
MALYRNGAFTTDAWRVLEAGDALPADEKVLLTKADFLARRDELAARNAPFGVKLVPGDDLAGLEDFLPRLSLIVLDFPRYGDGRPYSLARLLRERHDYRGELRASGDVLRDQIAFMRRAGIDAFDVTHEDTIAALREGKIALVRRHYQRASVDGEETREQGHGLRRVSPQGALPGDALHERDALQALPGESA